MLSLFTDLILTLFQTFLYLILFLIISILALKLWLEPWKGVCRCRSQLKGKVVLVTGGNTGIGLETARDLARRGARVIIASRNTEKSKVAVEDIIATTGNEKVEFKYLDLSSFESVRRFVDEFNRSESVLDVLVNNAGCAGLKRKVTRDGIDLVMQINYLGPFLLTNLLLDKLINSKPSRIVIVSSYAHYFAKLDTDDLAGLKTKGYWTTYANSKLCNVLWAKALSKKLPAGVIANALHPGVVKTEIWNKVPAVFRTVILSIIDLMFKTSAEGAQTSIHLAVANELCNSSGLFYADCKPINPSAAANDTKLIETVWERSIQLTKSDVQINL
ncbi:Retinol dehydrogenase 12 [Eumeta japonica]|uniref:Retinol dehydrogenase 12 n=1 Tax=Eumeta variegata TaxID=151549 RepID=A0A4C1WU13_EUMVA|nr:Retinol dehydrogenase 12 [Eumeta japonica]